MKRWIRMAAMILPVAAAAFLACMPADGGDKKGHGHDDGPKEAVVVLLPTKGQEVSGIVLMKQMDGFVHVTGTVQKLTPGKHGFHIHEFGDTRAPDGTSAGGHFNPDGHPHGGPKDEKHHAGDLGNIMANEKGDASIDMKAMGLKVVDVLGRGMVVHAKEDDLKTQPTGDAGGRVAVGVIGVAQTAAKKK